jgi:hypothetical protein
VSHQLVDITGGVLRQRDNRTKRTWTVELEPFLLDRSAVTQALYRDVTGAAPSASDAERNPVEGVSWEDAVRFCNLFSEHSGYDPGESDCDSRQCSASHAAALRADACDSHASSMTSASSVLLRSRRRLARTRTEG